MSKKNSDNVNYRYWLAAVLTVFFSAQNMAADFVPYPGKREVRLMGIEAPNVIVVNFDTDMVGFFRTIRIRLPGIEIPKDVPQADTCERELARKAIAFTRHYLASAKKIYVEDMRMQTSADEEAIAPILTNQGSLSEALKKQGLARPDTVASGLSWCK